MIRTGLPARIDDWTVLPGPVVARHVAAGFGQCVAAPLIIEGTIWGLISAFGEANQVLPPGSEARLADFTQLMASAIANAQVRDELHGLAERQGAALRRVATLVAGQAPSQVIFDAVAAEASRALGVARVDVGRHDAHGTVTLLGSTGRQAPDPAPRGPVAWPGGQRAPGPAQPRWGGRGRSRRLPEPPASSARRTPTRPESDDEADSGEVFASAVGAPILVDGEAWGVIVVLSDEPLPADTETRLTDFTHLVASSISNVHARDSLIASRARIVTASDETRRLIERNLHDGIQQRLVSLGLGLRAVRASSGLTSDVQAGLDQATRDLESVLEEIRVFSRGLHPALLARAGLGPSLRELARRSPIPAAITARGVPRLPQPVETAVYYVVSEALANAAKHSGAGQVTVTVTAEPAKVRATVSDDGAGGAVLGRGSGLIGLVDRVEALGGQLHPRQPARPRHDDRHRASARRPARVAPGGGSAPR